MLSNNPELCYTIRSNLIEIIHHGIICCNIINDNNENVIIYQKGNIDQLFYLRSALKYIQILPLLESGAIEYYNFNDKEISVMCSSHNSEECHLETVRSILLKINSNENDLRCGGHTPVSEEAAFQYVRNGVQTPFRDHIYNNCSGKHAGFLALCKFLGHPIEGYLSLDHPIQLLIREAVSNVFCVPENELHVGIDGCSAPAYALTARQAAFGFARLSSSESHSFFTPKRYQAIKRMIQAITSYPEMIYGNNGFCTELMKEFNGNVIGKRGAAGVYMGGIINHHIGIAVKIDDGTMGPQYNVTIGCLKYLYLNYLKKNNKLNENEINEILISLQKLSRFDITPSINSMGIEVGLTKCIDHLFDEE